MTPDVISVTPLADYLLEAEFSDGQKRRFSMKNFLRYPAFSALAENNLFQRAHVENGTVAWSDDIDLSPDTLYLQGMNC